MNQTPEEFGKSMVKVFNDEDFDEFKRYLVTLDELKELVNNTELSSDKEKEKVLSTIDERMESELAKVINHFQTEKLDSLAYVNCIYTISLDGEVEFTKNYRIIAESKSDTISIGFRRLVKTKNGWKSLDNFIVR